MLSLIRHPLFILTLAVLAVTAMALRSAFTLQQVAELRSAVNQSTQRLMTNDSLWAAVQDAESSQRGYLLTGEPGYLEPYDDAIARAESGRWQLRNLYADTPERQALLAEIETRSIEKLLELESSLAAFGQHGLDAALALVRSDSGRETMEALRAAVVQLQQLERYALHERGESVRQQVAAALWQTWATIAGAFLLTLLAPWLQRRESLARQQAQQAADEAMGQLRAAHAELERSHESFLQSLGEALFELDIDSRQVHWSADFESITGHTPAAFGSGLDDWQRRVHAEDIDTVLEQLEQTVRKGGLLDVEYRLRHADGTWRWVNGRGVPQAGSDGRISRVIGTLRDVTPLHDARHQLDLALWAADIAPWAVDRDTGRYHASRTWTAQLGYPPEEAPRNRAEWAQLIHPDDRERVLAHVRDVDQGRVARYDCEMRIRHRDGSYRWFLSRGTPRLDAAGRVIGLIGARIDVTTARENQMALEESRARLRAYAIALDQALEHERARIAREIHDELGQAMTSLKLDLGWLDRRIGALDPGDARIAPMRERIAEMQAFLDQSIGSVRRIASELRPPLLDSAGIGPALEAQAQAFCGRAGLATKITIDPDLKVGGEQATALFRIAQEAFTNIVRHAEASRVEVTLAATGSSVRLEIIDDGVGIAGRQRAGGARLHAGFGLLGIEERARLAGGTAAVEPAEGGGTRVWAELPLRPAQDGAADSRAAA